MAESSRGTERRPARVGNPKDRRARGRALVIFYITAFSAVVIGAILLCIFVFFKVGDVRITGDAGYNEEDILRICGIQEGDNLVLLSTKDRERELEHRFPYIEDARIVKHIPSTVEVQITAAKTCFSVEFELGYLYVSRTGKVLEVIEKVLAANEKGLEILRNASEKIPVVTRHSDIVKLDEKAKEIYEISQRAADQYAFFSEKTGACLSEQTSPIQIFR